MMGILHVDSFARVSELDAPLTEVFAAFKDIARWPKWIPALSAAAPISEVPWGSAFVSR